ncbi:MAG: B3/B4 domain-containing protein [Promethearchaeota archaeon]
MKTKKFIIDKSLAENGFKIHVVYFEISNFNNSISNYSYEKYVVAPKTDEIKKNYELKTLKDDPIIKIYRQFYWAKLKIDPTKIRPSGEALIRRVLQGKKLPTINRFVDAYNWASAVSKIPIGAYDMDKFEGNITLRKANKGEEFLAIGNKKITLKGNELITCDEIGTILSQFPYRDADKTKITNKTKNIFVACLGVEGISKKDLMAAANRTILFLKKCEFPDMENSEKLNNFLISEINYNSNF